MKPVLVVLGGCLAGLVLGAMIASRCGESDAPAAGAERPASGESGPQSQPAPAQSRVSDALGAHFAAEFPGEIDFLVQVMGRIVPFELKSGAAGAMKSLHQFVQERGLAFAVRVDANPPSLQEVDVKTTQGDAVRYRLLNLPGYLLWRAGELAREVFAPGR